MSAVAVAVAAAEAETLRLHQAGQCHLQEWSCSHCEAEGPRVRGPDPLNPRQGWRDN